MAWGVNAKDCLGGSRVLYCRGKRYTYTMRPEFIKEMKQVLTDKRAKLLGEIKAMDEAEVGLGKAGVVSFPSYGDKEDENAAKVATFSDNLSIDRTLEGMLHDVERALQRIAEGSYGKCKYCGQEIDERRLRARPESGSCVACKSKLQQQ